MSALHTPEELAQQCANAVDPALFAPAIRKAADDFYERLMTGVQDYLKDNVEFNLASHITTLEYAASHLRKSNTEAADMIEELAASAGQYMSQFGQALDCNGIAYGPPQIEADERLRAAIAKAKGGAA